MKQQIKEVLKIIYYATIALVLFILAIIGHTIGTPLIPAIMLTIFIVAWKLSGDGRNE